MRQNQRYQLDDGEYKQVHTWGGYAYILSRDIDTHIFSKCGFTFGEPPKLYFSELSSYFQEIFSCIVSVNHTFTGDYLSIKI